MPPCQDLGLCCGAVAVTAAGLTPRSRARGSPGLGQGGAGSPLPLRVSLSLLSGVRGFSPSFVSKFEVVFFSLAGGLIALGGGKSPPGGVPSGLVPAEAELPQSALSSSASAASRFARGEEEEGQSRPPLPWDRGCPLRARLAHGAPPPALGCEDGCPQAGWQEHGGDTFREQRGSRGSELGSWWCRGEFQGLAAPSRILTGCKPSSGHLATLVKTQTAAPLVRRFLPGLGGAAGARLCQGLVISSEDVSELLGLAAEITELFQLPIPPCLAFGKFPFSSLESPWVVGGVGGGM